MDGLTNYLRQSLVELLRLSGETQQGILVRMGGSLCIVYDSTENVWRVSPQVMNSNSDPRDGLEKKIFQKFFFQCL